jgi:hypothetical protein
MMIFSDFKGKNVSGLDGEAAAQRLRSCWHNGESESVRCISLSSAYFPILSIFYYSFDGYEACFNLRTSN